MLSSDGSEQCPVRKEIENMIEAQRWATVKMLAHRPERMMRIALEVRSLKLSCGEHKPSPDLARRVLVRGSIPPRLIPSFPVKSSACSIRSPKYHLVGAYVSNSDGIPQVVGRTLLLGESLDFRSHLALLF